MTTISSNILGTWPTPLFADDPVFKIFEKKMSQKKS